MNSVLLSSVYAFPPNFYGYCGSSSFANILRDYLAGKKPSKQLEKELKKFKVQYAYLSFIARANKLKPFDFRVVKAFWIGNSLLKNITRLSLQHFLQKNLFPKNSSRAKFLAKNLPSGLVPHHSFNSLYVNFVTGSVRQSISNYDSCCITAGKIISLSKNKAKVKRFCILWKNGFVLGQKLSTVDITRNGVQLIKLPKKGDLVSVHWGMIVAKITPNDLNSLIKYTQINMDSLNSC